MRHQDHLITYKILENKWSSAKAMERHSLEDTTGENHWAVAAVEESGFDRQVWKWMGNLDLIHSRVKQGWVTCRVLRITKIRICPWLTQTCFCFVLAFSLLAPLYLFFHSSLSRYLKVDLFELGQLLCCMVQCCPFLLFHFKFCDFGIFFLTAGPQKWLYFLLEKKIKDPTKY